MTATAFVERERARVRAWRLGAAIAASVAISSLTIAAAAVLLGNGRWLVLPAGTPIVAWIILIGGNAAIAWMTVSWLRQRGSAAAIAETIERERGMRAGSLRGVMEVGDSSVLGRHAARAMDDRLRAFDDDPAPHARRGARLHFLRTMTTAIVAAAGLTLIAPFFFDGVHAVLRPDRAWRGTLLPVMRFRGVPPAAMRGERIRVEIDAPGRVHVQLRQRSAGQGWISSELAVDRERGIAEAVVGPLAGEVYLVGFDGRTETDTVVIRVAERPFVGAVSIRATYPTYLGRETETIAVGEPVRVPRGTVLDIGGRASTALRSVRLSNGSDTISLPANGHAFAGRWGNARSGIWQWHATTAAGSVLELPPAVEIDVIPDSVPTVELVSPAGDTLVLVTERTTLLLRASDDHALTSVELRRWSHAGNGAGGPSTTRLADTRDALWSGSVVLTPAGLGLGPGRVARLQVAATDNSPWSQRGESRMLIVRVPTAEERRELARSSGDSVAAAAAAIVAAERALEQRTEDAARERGDRTAQAARAGTSSDPSKVGYEAAEKARALANDQRELGDQVKALSDAARTLEQQLRSAGALDSSLAQQLQDAQALLRDALTPELMAQMQKLQGAQQLSRDDAQRSMVELQEMQRRLREQLEKSAELLKRAALEGAMQTLSDDAKELAARQRALVDSVNAAAVANRATLDSARSLTDRTDRIGNAMRQLEARLRRDGADRGADQTSRASSHADSSESKLRAAAAPSPTEGSASLRDAATQMERAAQSMQDARDAQVQEWKQELTSELDRAIQEMLHMAREESALSQRARSADPERGEIRGQQSALKQGVDQTSQRLQREGQKSALLSNRSQQAVADARDKVDQATRQSTQQQLGQAAATMGDAADALNRAAASLARDRERANASGSATGFAEMIRQMQELANKQGGINAQSQGLLALPVDQQTAATQASARALARQQRQLAQQLEELGDGAGGDRATKLAQEARQLAEALDGGRIDAPTIARQQQLFRRLLDAGRTLEKEEREESDRREAQAATNPGSFENRNTNAAGKAATRFREPTWEELRGLSADERRLILEYFKRINGGKGG